MGGIKLKVWRFGVIGCGNMAGSHIDAIQRITCAKLLCVSSRDEMRARKAGERAQAEWVTDYRDMLERPDIDIVCLTTSSGSHASIGAEVLSAGKHLLVEKPMTMYEEEARKLIELAHSKGLTLSVVSQRRFEESFRLAKKAITEGRLGKLLLIEATTPFYRPQAYYDSADWRGTLQEDGGALMNQGIHQIDLMLWLGGAVRTVYGKTATRTHRMEAEDIGAGIVSFENGALGTLLASTSLHPGFPPSVKVYGEYGAIHIVGSSIAHWSVEGMTEPNVSNGAMGGDCLKLQIEDLIHSIAGKRAPVVTGHDGLEAIRLIHRIYESSRSATELPIASIREG